MKVQKGSTLIVVLILLLVITVIGTLAVRQSLTSLNIATNSQAQQLLMQSSDSVLYRLGAEGFASTSGNPTSLLGYALQNQGKEVVFVLEVRPLLQRLSLSQIRVFYNGTKKIRTSL